LCKFEKEKCAEKEKAAITAAFPTDRSMKHGQSRLVALRDTDVGLVCGCGTSHCEAIGLATVISRGKPDAFRIGTGAATCQS
jgi:hypothetical protein